MGFLDPQRRLPTEVEVMRVGTVEEVWEAIKRLAVRGAPAIGDSRRSGGANRALTDSGGRARHV